MLDFRACRWPEGLSALDTSLAEHFDAMNEPEFSAVLASLQASELPRKQQPVISFSHFLPLQVSALMMVPLLCGILALLFIEH